MRPPFPTLAPMPHRSRFGLPRAVPAMCAAIAAALALGACGSSDSDGGEIPPATAAELQGALSDLEGATAAGSCTDAREAVDLFRERVEAVGDVAADVREDLVAGAVQLETLVQEEACVPTGTTDAGEVKPPTTTPPATTTTPEPEEEKEEKDEEGEDGESTAPPEGETGPNAPPGPEGNPNQEEDGGEGSGTDGAEGTGGTGGTGAEEGG